MREPRKPAGWHDRPDLEPGTVVAPPVLPDGCWAIATQAKYHSAPKRARGCSATARRGALTCLLHRNLEPIAREAQKRLQAAQEPSK
jgi:hypothetical protein